MMNLGYNNLRKWGYTEEKNKRVLMDFNISSLKESKAAHSLNVAESHMSKSYRLYLSGRALS
jgi:hypothetical protein